MASKIIELPAECLNEFGSTSLIIDESMSAVVSLALSEWFFGAGEKLQLQRLADEHYNCFDESQRRELVDITTKLLSDVPFNWNLFAGKKRHLRLFAAIDNHLKKSDYLNWEGFVNFRLFGYSQYLLTMMTVAADELLAMEEDREFLQLLKNFSADSNGEELHLFLTADGYYNLCVTAKEGYKCLEGGREEGYEDILISNILIRSPRRLIVHSQSLSSKAITLLREVFGDRIELRRNENDCMARR